MNVTCQIPILTIIKVVLIIEAEGLVIISFDLVCALHEGLLLQEETTIVNTFLFDVVLVQLLAAS